MLAALYNNLVILSIAGLFCIALQKLIPLKENQKLWLNRESGLNWQYFFMYLVVLFHSLAWLKKAVLASVGLSFGKVANVPAYIAEMNIFLQALIVFVLVDLVAYWMHRLYHSVPFLWKFHAIHHSPKELDWLATWRFHPLELLLTHLVQYCIIAGMFGFSLGLAISMQILRSYYGYLVHANINWNYGVFRYVFASPIFHHWHHTRLLKYSNKNYAGVFSIWDYLFGSALKNNEKPMHLGISEDIGSNAFSQTLYPFKSVFRKWN